MAESRQFLTRSAYAAHRGKSRQYISRLAEAGVLVMRGKLVDVAASNAVLDDRPDRVAVPALNAQTGTTYAQARIADMVYRARLRRLEFETRQGRLVEAATVKERWASILAQLKERVLAVPDRLAPEVAATTDERQVREVLKREMHALLNVLRSDVQHAR